MTDIKMNNIKHIDALIEVPGRARATINATAARLYFELVTTDTSDSGSIPFNELSFNRIIDIIAGDSDGLQLPGDLNSIVYLDDTKIILTEEKLNRLIEFLTDESSHLEFLCGFK